MSGKSTRRSLIAVALVLVALWALDVVRRGPLPVQGTPPAGRPPVATGVVHVHTTASDGGGDGQEVIAAAQAAGLDFVAISDHNNLDLESLEGWHGELLVLVGTEVSTMATSWVWGSSATPSSASRETPRTPSTTSACSAVGPSPRTPPARAATCAGRHPCFPATGAWSS
jgi:hypothetical protein